MDNNKKLYELNGTKVYFEIGEYASDPMVMAISAFSEDGEPYNTLSVNLGNSIGNNSLIPPNCTFIDTNNNIGIDKFLKTLGAEAYTRFGSPVVGYSGFCSYPLYEFPEKLLCEMDTEGYEKHLKNYQTAFREAQRQMNIEMFGFDPFANDGTDDESEDEAESLDGEDMKM